MLRILKRSEVLWLSLSIVIFSCGAHFVPSGAAFTRFQTLRLRKIFPDILADQLISYGSCQFPTLGFVVERFKAIQAFVPEAFYKIKGMFGETVLGSIFEGLMWIKRKNIGATDKKTLQR